MAEGADSKRAVDETGAVPNGSSIRAPLIALAFGAIGMIAAAWIGAQVLGTRLTEDYVKRESLAWAERAINELQKQRQTFSDQSLTDIDKANLDTLVRNSSIYRYVLFGADGKVFWSSYAPKIGKTEGRAYFADVVAKGFIYIKHATKPAHEVDGFLDSEAGRGVAVDAPRRISEIYVPVLKDGKFAGAMEVYIDVTGIVGWFGKVISAAALLLCIAIAVVFLMVGWLVYSYGRERTWNTAMLVKARDEALQSARENREMSAQLREVNDDVVKLNRDLENNLKALRETQDQLVKRGKMAQLGQLTATVAHEIRNPLGSVRTAAFLIERKLAGSCVDIARPLSRINNGVNRCDQIITELLDFARSSSPNHEPVKVDDWVSKIVHEQLERLPSKVRVECTLSTGESEAQFDTGKMERVLVNLLSNASEAMVGKSGEEASFSDSEPVIAVETAMTARGVEISVSDSGPGMDAETIARVLEPLFTTKSFGVGLGLPAVEKILQQHGGGLEIDSTKGKGARFTAWFPVKHAVEEAA